MILSPSSSVSLTRPALYPLDSPGENAAEKKSDYSIILVLQHSYQHDQATSRQHIPAGSDRERGIDSRVIALTRIWPWTESLNFSWIAGPDPAGQDLVALGH